MKITFLGTGTSQGVPFIGCSCEVCTSTDRRDNRLRSSIAIEAGGQSIIVDTGPDFRQQMLRSGITHIDALLYTHSHKDHIAGLDDIRAYNYWQQQPIDIYATEATQAALRMEYSYIFSGQHYPGIPELTLHTIANKDFEVDGLPVTPVSVMHFKMPVLGFRIGPFAYITDANYISEVELAKLKGVEVLVLNALRHEKHISHFTLAEAMEIAQRVSAETTYFTHISHQLGLHSSVSETLPAGMLLAYDGLCINI